LVLSKLYASGVILMATVSPIREEDVQRSIIQWCHLHRLEVMQTSRRGIKCPTCRKTVYGGDGVTRGLPDLLVRVGSTATWLAVEVKGPKTRLSQDQKSLLASGSIHVVRSLDEFIALIVRL
jgi:hypothetical protein